MLCLNFSEMLGAEASSITCRNKKQFTQKLWRDKICPMLCLNSSEMLGAGASFITYENKH